MDWKILEDIQKKRRDNASQALKHCFAAYQESQDAVSRQQAQHTLFLEQLQHLSHSPFQNMSAFTKATLDHWRSRIAMAQTQVAESNQTILHLKKASKECFSQWQAAEACYLKALRQFEKYSEVRKENEQYQKRIRALEDDKQLDELPASDTKYRVSSASRTNV